MLPKSVRDFLRFYGDPMVTKLASSGLLEVVTAPFEEKCSYEELSPLVTVAFRALIVHFPPLKPHLFTYLKTLKLASLREIAIVAPELRNLSEEEREHLKLLIRWKLEVKAALSLCKSKRKLLSFLNQEATSLLCFKEETPLFAAIPEKEKTIIRLRDHAFSLIPYLPFHPYPEASTFRKEEFAGLKRHQELLLFRTNGSLQLRNFPLEQSCWSDYVLHSKTFTERLSADQESFGRAMEQGAHSVSNHLKENPDVSLFSLLAELALRRSQVAPKEKRHQYGKLRLHVWFTSLRVEEYSVLQKEEEIQLTIDQIPLSFFSGDRLYHTPLSSFPLIYPKIVHLFETRNLPELFWWLLMMKPWERGDPSIGEMLIRGMALSTNEPLPGWREGVIPWVEVSLSETPEEFAKKFPTLFEKQRNP